jgi:TfoX/Sxy family transcriptional regulator of competence genes
MAYDEILAERVRTAISHLPDVEEKKMFSGLTFMLNGKMCVTVGKDRIMCRIDPSIHEGAIRREGARTVVMKGREYKGFVYVSRDVLKTKKHLEYWLKLAIDFNKFAKASKKRNTSV